MHIICIILPLLVVASYARPSPNTTSDQWSPIETETQPLRYTSQFREFVPIKHYTRPSRPATLHNVLKKRKNPSNTENHRRKVPVKYKIANATSLKQNANKILSEKDKAILNQFFATNFGNKSNSVSNKNWPNSVIQSLEDVQSYNNYFMNNNHKIANTIKTNSLNRVRNKTSNHPNKLITQHLFTKVSENLYGSNNSKWYEIKVKPVTQTVDQSLYSNLGSLPVEVVENSNPFPIKIPNVHIGSHPSHITDLIQDNVQLNHASNNGANNNPITNIGNNVYYQSSTVGPNIHSNQASTSSSNIGSTLSENPDNLSNNIIINQDQTNLDNTIYFQANSTKYQVQNNVNQSPDQTHIINTVHLTPDVPENTSSICPSVSITSNTFYNNKDLCPDLDIVINNQVQTSNNVFTDLPTEEVEYDASSSDLAPLDENPDTEYLDEVGEAGDSLETNFEPEEVFDDGLGESASSSGVEDSQSSSSSSGNRPQLPELPTLPQNDGSSDSNGGIFDTGLSILGTINLPFLALILAPLVLIMTGTLGLTTFFIPWTIFPTLFLSRNAKHIEEPVVTYDGWFWHTKYKTWSSLGQIDPSGNRALRAGNFILRLIEEFEKKYDNKSWKRRKK